MAAIILMMSHLLDSKTTIIQKYVLKQSFYMHLSLKNTPKPVKSV